jgi:Leucine Rich Repeat.
MSQRSRYNKLGPFNALKKIEGLDKLINLEELNLSYNMITEIEGLENLKKLKDLNLAENNIQRIENIVITKNLHLHS